MPIIQRSIVSIFLPEWRSKTYGQIHKKYVIEQKLKHISFEFQVLNLNVLIGLKFGACLQNLQPCKGLNLEAPSWCLNIVVILIVVGFFSDNIYLCLAVLDGVFCVIFLHGRNSPQSSPTSTPRLLKSLSFEIQPDDVIEKPMSPMQYARSGLGTAELNGKLIAAGKKK